MTPPACVGRRPIHTALLLAAGCLSGLLPGADAARGATGVRDLDTAAITAKAPDKVVLVAIAKAGARLVAVGEHGVIIWSDDNGATWTQSAVPVDVTLTAVAFADASDGWAAGHDGVILHTADGGRTWQLQLNGLQVNQLTLAAAQAAVARNDPSPGTPRAIMRANHFLASGPANPFLAIWVSGPQNALVFGSYRMVMKTTDGGKDWTDWSLHVGDAVSHNLYGAAAVGGDLYVAGEAGAVFRSTDGGATFPAVTPPGDATMFEVAPTGDGGLFVGGVAGEAFRSADHGASWSAVTLGTQSNLTAMDTLADGAILVGDEAGNLFISRDHAKSFSRLGEVEPMEIFGLIQADDGDVVAVGSGGVSVIPAREFGG